VTVGVIEEDDVGKVELPIVAERIEKGWEDPLEVVLVAAVLEPVEDDLTVMADVMVEDGVGVGEGVVLFGVGVDWTLLQVKLQLGCDISHVSQGSTISFPQVK